MLAIFKHFHGLTEKYMKLQVLEQTIARRYNGLGCCHFELLVIQEFFYQVVWNAKIFETNIIFWIDTFKS